jgi:hypothetical protein
MKTWLDTINKIKFFREEYDFTGKFSHEMSKVKFLQGLEKKVMKIFNEKDLA